MTSNSIGSRVIPRLLSGVVLCGMAAALWIVSESQGEEPGANMVLMGLPLIAVPLLLVGALNFWLVSRQQAFAPWESRMHSVFALVTALPMTLIWCLG